MKRNFTNIAKLGVTKIFDARSSSQHGFDFFLLLVSLFSRFLWLLKVDLQLRSNGFWERQLSA